MKLISWNTNGLRNVHKKGLLSMIEEENPEIICFQETKVQESQLSFELLYINGYKAYFNSALKKGYSGVAVYSKKEPIRVENKLGLELFDEQGRLLELEFDDYILLNIYMPHGGRQKENLVYKLASYNALLEKLKNIYQKQIVLAGDFNIAHEEIDLARPKDNMDNIMFSPVERQKIEDLLELGFVDSFRYLNKSGDNYTWWSYANDARERNLGWRIDYIFLTKNILKKLKDAFILKNIKGSDHCPIGIVI